MNDRLKFMYVFFLAQTLDEYVRLGCSLKFRANEWARFMTQYCLVGLDTRNAWKENL